MRTILFVAIILLFYGSGVWADVCPGMNTTVRPKGFENLVVSTTPLGLTVPPGAEMGTISVETDAIRYRDDGVEPTASLGVRVPSGTVFTVCLGSLSTIKFVRVTNDASLNAAYYGR